MAITGSPWKAARDSPSRQLLWELSRLAVSQQEDLYEQLDRESQEREKAHKKALAEAVAQHERVRRDAEVERDRLEQQIEQERERREIEAHQEEERQRQARAEQEKLEKRRAAERAEAAARAERAATEERDAQLARQKAEKERQDAAKAKATKAAQEAQVRKRAEEERKSKEAAAAAAAAERPIVETRPHTSTVEQSGPSITQNSGLTPRESEHQRYLQIHKNLKSLRRFMGQQVKQDARLKSKMGDMRRMVRKSIGQVIEGKGVNTKPQKAILQTLREATTSFPQPTVNLADYIAGPIPDTQAPALLVYLLNQFAKAVISQFINEASVAPRVADPIGTIAISMFANNEFRINGISLIDILIAKFHVVCPPLFGIYGDEKTNAGRTRLGWWREEPEGPWISDQSHQDRMSGLGAGYAAISLRNFEKSAASNPYPPYHYWQAVATILNVPVGKVTDTHLYVLRALLMNSEARFLQFFGDAAKKLLQIALTEYPKRAREGSVAAVVLSTLKDAMTREKKFYF